MFTFPGGIGHVLVTRHGFGPHSWHLDRKWLHLLIPPLLCIPCLWATVWGYFQVHGEACEMPQYRCRLGCILLKTAAILLLTGRPLVRDSAAARNLADMTPSDLI